MDSDLRNCREIRWLTLQILQDRYFPPKLPLLSSERDSVLHPSVSCFLKGNLWGRFTSVS